MIEMITSAIKSVIAWLTKWGFELWDSYLWSGVSALLPEWFTTAAAADSPVISQMKFAVVTANAWFPLREAISLISVYFALVMLIALFKFLIKLVRG